MSQSVKEKINILLMSMLGSETLVEQWWKSPNKAFDMRTPESLMETEKHIVIDYVLWHAHK